MDDNQIQHLYTDLNMFSLRGDWPDLEAHFRQLAVQHCSPELAGRIQSIDLSGYTTRLGDFLTSECMRSAHHAVKALYFEYDPAHSWDSHLHFCDRYTPAAAGNETWTRHWIDRVTGPDLPEFAALYRQHGELRSEDPAAASLTFYLFARTTAAFGTAVHQAPTHKMSICIGHAGQERLTRVYER